MPIYDRMLNLAQTKQQIASGEMLNKLRGVEIAQTIRNNQIEDQASQLIQKETLLNLSRRDKLEQTGNAKDAVSQQPPSLQESFRTMKETQEEADFYTNAAKSVLGMGGSAAVNFKAARELEQRAEKARSQNLQAQLRYRVAQNDLMANKAKIAGAYSDEQASYTISQLDGLQPKWDRQLDLDRDPVTGKPIAGKKTSQAMRTLAKEGETSDQQARRELDALKVIVEQSREETNKKREEETKAENQRRDTRAREKEADKKASAKTKTPSTDIPEPSDRSIESQANIISRLNSVDPNQAREAARDKLLAARANRRNGMDPEQADNAADDMIAKRMRPNPDTKSKFTNIYDKSPAKVTPLDKSIAAVMKGGKVEVKMVGDKMKLVGPPTVTMSQAQAALDAATTDEERQNILNAFAKMMDK